MKVVLQRVLSASVRVGGEVLGEIGRGYLVLLGVGEGDTEETTEAMAEKIAKLRIFQDENGKTNRSAAQVGGELLVVSQFTLWADCTGGNRPSFLGAGNPQLAKRLYELFLELCRGKFPKVASGSFGADMQVSLCNDGPFTLILENGEGQQSL